MARYFFDSRDGDELMRDEEGLELSSLEAAQFAATRGLADWAKDAIPGAVSRELTIEVRDGAEHEVFGATLSFNARWSPATGM